jgi:hypothetical protein
MMVAVLSLRPNPSVIELIDRRTSNYSIIKPFITRQHFRRCARHILAVGQADWDAFTTVRPFFKYRRSRELSTFPLDEKAPASACNAVSAAAAFISALVVGRNSHRREIARSFHIGIFTLEPGVLGRKYAEPPPKITSGCAKKLSGTISVTLADGIKAKHGRCVASLNFSIAYNPD